jgi:hypothetical protein
MDFRLCVDLFNNVLSLAYVISWNGGKREWLIGNYVKMAAVCSKVLSQSLSQATEESPSNLSEHNWYTVRDSKSELLVLGTTRQLGFEA